MSNQVYSNASHKYFPMPALVTYLLPNASDPPIAAAGTYLANFVRASYSPEPYNALFSPGSEFTFETEGLYSITANIGLSAAAGITSIAWIAELILQNSWGYDNAVVCRHKYYATVPAAGNIVDSLSFTGYFHAGDALNVRITNNDGVNAIAMMGSSSILVITKLA